MGAFVYVEIVFIIYGEYGIYIEFENMAGAGVGYSMSGNDLMMAVGGKARIMTYRDLAKCRTIDEALGEHDALFLLYETKPKYGHWTLVFRQGETIEHFDSYNHKPDAELDWVPMDYRKIANMLYPKLTKLLYDSGREIHYNDFALQAENGAIATCGRWCAWRLQHRDRTAREFAELVADVKKQTGLTTDEIVVAAVPSISECL